MRTSTGRARAMPVSSDRKRVSFNIERPAEDGGTAQPQPQPPQLQSQPQHQASARSTEVALRQKKDTKVAIDELREMSRKVEHDSMLNAGQVYARLDRCLDKIQDVGAGQQAVELRLESLKTDIGCNSDDIEDCRMRIQSLDDTVTGLKHEVAEQRDREVVEQREQRVATCKATAHARAELREHVENCEALCQKLTVCETHSERNHAEALDAISRTDCDVKQIQHALSNLQIKFDQDVKQSLADLERTANSQLSKTLADLETEFNADVDRKLAESTTKLAESTYQISHTLTLVQSLKSKEEQVIANIKNLQDSQCRSEETQERMVHSFCTIEENLSKSEVRAAQESLDLALQISSCRDELSNRLSAALDKSEQEQQKRDETTDAVIRHLKESLAVAESKADAAEESLALEINNAHESSVSSLANVQQKLEASVANVQQKLEASVRELGVELQGLHQNCGIQAQELNRGLLHAVQEVRQQGSQEMLHVVSQFHHEILKEENAAIQCVADEASDRLDECFLRSEQQIKELDDWTKDHFSQLQEGINQTGHSAKQLNADLKVLCRRWVDEALHTHKRSMETHDKAIDEVRNELTCMVDSNRLSIEKVLHFLTDNIESILRSERSLSDEQQQTQVRIEALSRRLDGVEEQKKHSSALAQDHAEGTEGKDKHGRLLQTLDERCANIESQIASLQCKLHEDAMNGNVQKEIADLRVELLDHARQQQQFKETDKVEVQFEQLLSRMDVLDSMQVATADQLSVRIDTLQEKLSSALMTPDLQKKISAVRDELETHVQAFNLRMKEAIEEGRSRNAVAAEGVIRLERHVEDLAQHCNRQAANFRKEIGKEIDKVAEHFENACRRQACTDECLTSQRMSVLALRDEVQAESQKVQENTQSVKCVEEALDALRGAVESQTAETKRACFDRIDKVESSSKKALASKSVAVKAEIAESRNSWQEHVSEVLRSQREAAVNEQQKEREELQMDYEEALAQSYQHLARIEALQSAVEHNEALVLQVQRQSNASMAESMQALQEVSHHFEDKLAAVKEVNHHFEDKLAAVNEVSHHFEDKLVAISRDLHKAEGHHNNLRQELIACRETVKDGLADSSDAIGLLREKVGENSEASRHAKADIKLLDARCDKVQRQNSNLNAMVEQFHGKVAQHSNQIVQLGLDIRGEIATAIRERDQSERHKIDEVQRQWQSNLNVAVAEVSSKLDTSVRGFETGSARLTDLVDDLRQGSLRLSAQFAVHVDEVQARLHDDSTRLSARVDEAWKLSCSAEHEAREARELNSEKVTARASAAAALAVAQTNRCWKQSSCVRAPIVPDSTAREIYSYLSS